MWVCFILPIHRKMKSRIRASVPYDNITLNENVSRSEFTNYR